MLSFDLTGIKYISFAECSNQNAQFYHYHFTFGNAFFLEAPVILNSTDLNEKTFKKNLFNSYIFSSCFHNEFFNSLKELLEKIVDKNNLIHNG